MPAYRDGPKRMEDLLSPIFATPNPTWADVQNSLWLGPVVRALRAPTAEGTGPIPGRGTRTPRAAQHGSPPPPDKRFRQSL